MKSEPLCILLAEDNDDHAEIVTRSLSEHRVANVVIRARDGEEALDYLFDSTSGRMSETHPRPNLVLLDLRLPKVDGLEVLRRIKNSPDHWDIPVVVLTTSAAERDLVESFKLHANSYLVKPVDYSKFDEMIQAMGFFWLVWNYQGDQNQVA